MVYPATPFTQFIVQLQKKEKVHLGPVTYVLGVVAF